MSRTYRRKSGFGKTELAWRLFDWSNCNESNRNPPPIDPKSKEGKRIVARYKCDSGTHRFKEPGPSWFRNLFTERPQRQEARTKIRRYLRDEDYVVILNSKNPLDYYT